MSEHFIFFNSFLPVCQTEMLFDLVQELKLRLRQFHSIPCAGESQCLFMQLSRLLLDLVQTGSKSQGQIPEIVFLH